MRILILVAALAAIIAASAAAQTLDDWDAVKGKWPQIDQPIDLKAARFFLDPKLLREVATTEIEDRFRLKHTDVLDQQSKFDDARNALPSKVQALEKAKDALKAANDEVQSRQQDLLGAQTNTQNLPLDEQSIEVQKALATLAAAQTKQKQAQKTHDDAVRVVADVHAKIDDAAGQLAKARAAENAVVAERRAWLDAHPANRGAVLERDTIVIRFRRDTPISVVDGILHDNGLEVKSGGILRIALFVTAPIAKTGDGDGDASVRIRSIIAALKTKSGQWVLDAFPNLVLSGTVVPPRNGQGDASIAATERWNWFDGSRGTLAARDMKFPEAWNFKDAIKPANAPWVVVIDEAFSSHPDLPAKSICEKVVNHSGHGNHVAGIIGAMFGNPIGIDGAAPVINLETCAPGLVFQSTDDQLPKELKERAAVFTAVAQKFEMLASKSPPPRVINVSLGYKWNESLLRMADDEKSGDIRDFVKGAGASMRSLLNQHRDVLVVSAAGNESDLNGVISSAQWSNPFNWAAVGGTTADGLPRSDNVLIVQSNQSDDITLRVLDSSGDGNIAAPGQDIVSTIDGQSYGSHSGTSMATPEITALVALMLSYNPALTIPAIFRILDVGKPACPNAFIAMARAKPDEFARDLADLNGDSKVDMDDFEQFTKELVDFVRGRQTGNFTIDLNRDHRIDQNDAMFPRCDFNGDGKISIHDPAPVPVGAAGTLTMLTDLEVMLLAWKNPPLSRVELEQRLEAAANAALLTPAGPAGPP